MKLTKTQINMTMNIKRIGTKTYFCGKPHSYTLHLVSERKLIINFSMFCIKRHRKEPVILQNIRVNMSGVYIIPTIQRMS